jgi:hypothetical protein
VDDFAQQLLRGERSGKYSPLDVAQWLEEFASAARKHLALAEAQAGSRSGPEFRRMTADVAIQSGLGSFFAWKLRAGVLYALYEQSGEGSALEEALTAYRRARTAWADLANRAKGVYAPDITYGPEKHLRGHWVDRLAAIDDDIADMQKRLDEAKENGAPAQRGRERIRQAVRQALARPKRPSIACRHTPARHFRPGQPLEIELWLEKGKPQPRPISVRLHYRHVNQAELYRLEEMESREGRYRAVIPGDYTQSPYPLQYFFELHEEPQAAWLYPGFEPNLSNQPYFVVRRA